MTGNIFTNTLKHFNLVTRHRWVVFKLCCKAGIPWRGLVHDLSKFSPTEFWESVKYYNGSMSPILFAKRKQGYSKAWLHHKGRNKHHPEYWYDPMSRNVYNGKRWRNDTQLKYWNSRKDNMPLNEKNKSMVTEVFTQVSINGIEKTITKSNLKRLYKKYCE